LYKEKDENEEDMEEQEDEEEIIDEVFVSVGLQHLLY